MSRPGDAGTGPAVPAAQLAAVAKVRPPAAAGRARHRRAAAQYLAAYAVYQAIGLAAWWRLLAGGIASTLPAGSADSAQEVWFLAWIPHALGTGTDPLFSHALFAPAGVDLLSNTSVSLLGLLLAPVTVTAGPVAALGVAVIMAPAVSALGAFALCRRYVSWQPAAFIGGLCYGFGPFLATDLRYGHVDLTWLALPPLVLLAVDELLVRQRRAPLPTGAVLGTLVVLQFFVSTELLAITVLTCAVALVLAALRRPRAVAGRLRAAAPGLAVAAAVVAVALAYPMWAVVAGPRHVGGPVWPGVGRIGASLAAAVQPHAELRGVAFISGGNGNYLGVGLLVVLLAGAVAYRRSVPLRLSLALAAACFVASLGYDLHAGRTDVHVPMPAAVLGHLPLLDSLVPARFGAMVDLFAGAALAIVLDHLRRARRPAWLAATAGRRVAAAAAVAAVALAPLAVLPPWPYAATRAVAIPVLSTLAPPGRPGGATPPTVVVYPDAPDAVADEMVSQARGGFVFDLADGYAVAPGVGAGRAVEPSSTDGLWLVLAAASLHRLRLPLTAATRRAVLVSLSAARVDDVVVLPGAAGSAEVRAAFTSVLGNPTRHTDGASVWTVHGSHP